MQPTDTTQPPTAHSTCAPLSSAECSYRLTCEASGQSQPFTALPTPLDIRTALTGLFLFGGPSLVTAGALAERIVARPDEAACYGSVWTLERMP